jgi:glycosyltransferase involved in cell wall biosynthesis
VKRFMKSKALELADWLRYAPAVRTLLGKVKLAKEPAPQAGDPQALARSILRLCSVARLTGEEQTPGTVMQAIKERVALMDIASLDLTEFVPETKSRSLLKAAILKPWINDQEPGVLFVAFEYEWAKLLKYCALDQLSKRYRLVLSPCSSPYNLVNFLFPAVFPKPVFTLINHPEDVGVLECVSRNYRVVPLYTSHWLNPENFKPLPRTSRDIDILMVASWGKVKRHHVFFRALRQLPPSLKVVLIGQDQEGRTARSILEEARLYGVENRFTAHTSLPHEAVAEMVARSKISLLFSLREGSAVVVSESLFGDTPVGLLENAYNGSRSFINAETGRLLKHPNLAAQLRDFLAGYRRYCARRWAEANISCKRSSALLNDTLRKHAVQSGEQWTQDIATLCWRPDPQLVRPQDAPWLRDEWEWARTHLGVEIGPAPAAVQMNCVAPHESAFVPQ